MYWWAHELAIWLQAWGHMARWPNFVTSPPPTGFCLPKCRRIVSLQSTTGCSSRCCFFNRRLWAHARRKDALIVYQLASILIWKCSIILQKSVLGPRKQDYTQHEWMEFEMWCPLKQMWNLCNYYGINWDVKSETGLKLLYTFFAILMKIKEKFLQKYFLGPKDQSWEGSLKNGCGHFWIFSDKLFKLKCRKECLHQIWRNT